MKSRTELRLDKHSGHWRIWRITFDGSAPPVLVNEPDPALTIWDRLKEWLR
jgi:hypothetical protein